MSGGKKGKKVKAKAIPLNEFLGDAAPATKTSWADATEDDDDYCGYVSHHRPTAPLVLPTAPRAARDTSVNEDLVPQHGPFCAYVTNLPYDVEDEDLREFFAEMLVQEIRLPKDSSRGKGYGYVTFEDRKSLIDALNMADTNLKNRRVRIELSNNTTDDRRRMGSRMGDQRRDYNDDPERTTGDWRSARSNDNQDDREERSGGYRSRFGGDRARDEGRDGGFDESRPSNWRDAPRENTSVDRPRPAMRDNRGEGREWSRFGDRDRGMDRRDNRDNRDFRDGSRDRERDGGFGSRRNYNDDDKERWSNLRSAPREQPPSTTDGPAAPAAAEPARTRPKLALQPRTKPIEATELPVASTPSSNESPAKPEGANEDNTQPRPASQPVPAANIFGAAKPVDTAAREREIEERLAKNAEARAKEVESEKSKEAAAAPRAGPREGAWGRRNGEENNSRPTWRSNENRSDNRSTGGRQMSRAGDYDRRDYRDNRDHRDNRDSRDSRERDGSRGRSGGYASRGPRNDSRPPPQDGVEKEKKKDPEDEISRMPKAKDDAAPNFIASNKYSMLPDDIDPDEE